MKHISVAALKEQLEARPDLILLDVREPDERNAFNIGGHFLPLGNILSFQTDEIDDLKSKEIYVYCHSGRRSLQACAFLEQAGFEDLTNVDGGMKAWQEM
jgi:rhodanese-related sulfurtransferase